MTESRTTATAIAAELREALPTERHASIPALAQLLASVAWGELDPEEAAARIAAPEFVESLRKLHGRSLEAAGIALGFSSDTITVGNITASEGVAIGRGAIVIKLGVYLAEQAYNVHSLINPYLGLAPFTYAESERFAGREPDIEEAMTLLTSPGAQRTLLFVNGASGSGKSSFVQAGLVPKLEQHYRERRLVARHGVMRPGAQPLAALADALQQLGLPPDEAFAAAKPFMVGVPSSIPDEGIIGVLVIDQFEELFSSQCDPIQRDALFAILASLPPFPQLRMHLIATLRSDFLPELFERPALYEIAKQGIDLREIAKDELQEAIQRPLQQGHPEKRLEPELIKALVREAESEATYLPLLQVTLEKLFADGSLTLGAYQRPVTQDGCGGSIVGAIRQRAEEVYHYTTDGGGKKRERTSDERAAVMAIFLDLVEVSLADDPRRDVRRPRTLAELTRGNATRAQLVADLATARLLSTGVVPPDGRDVEVVDIIHESLIANWDRLQQAIAEQRDALQQRVRFEQALAEWQQHQRADKYLMIGVRLAEAEALEQRGDVALQGDDARAFYARSVQRRDEERQRRLRQIGLVAVGLGLLALVALVAAGIAVNRQQYADNLRATAVAEQQRADQQAGTAVAEGQRADTEAAEAKAQRATAIRNEQQAIHEERIARARELAAAAVSNLTIDPQLSILLATEAVSVTSTAGEEPLPEVLDALQQAVQTSRVERIYAGHAKGVQALSYRPDGAHLATASNDNTVKVWDMASGREVLSVTGHISEVFDVAYSPDGTRLATASADGTAKIWDAATGRELLSIEDHDGEVYSVAYSPDGIRLATGGADDTARIWEAATGQELLVLEHDKLVDAVTFSPDGQFIATASSTAATLWNSATGDKIGILGHGAIVQGLAFSPDGQLIATASVDGYVRVWDVASRHTITILQGHSSSVLSVAFSADGRYLATTSADGTARVWNPSTGQMLLTLAGHDDWVQQAAFSPDGTSLATASLDKTARIWSLAFLPSDSTLSVAFSPNGERLASSGLTEAYVWDAVSGRPVLRMQGHSGDVNSVTFSPDGSRIATASFDKTIRIWDATSAQQQLVLEGHEDGVNRVAFSPDGSRIATVSDDQTVKLWDVASGNVQLTLQGHEDLVVGLAYNHDGSRLATVDRAGVAIVWDTTSGQRVHTLRGPEDSEMNSVAFSPDGKLVATAGSDGNVRIWDTASGTQLRTLSHGTDALDVVFSLDSRRLATVSRQKTLKLWEVTTGTELSSLTLAAEPYEIAFSPDNVRIAVASAEGIVRIYMQDRIALLDLAHRRIIRAPTGEECRTYRLQATASCKRASSM